ncbi:regulatory protein ToxS [Photobacterium swingsii]|uniref:regulatory protein ToxS n=1 Tax=Photobacterium swingsii TaxID=680026 RepID=UPI003D0F34BE
MAQKSTPLAFSCVIVTASIVIFPQESLYQFLLTTKQWQSHNQSLLETRQQANHHDQQDTLQINQQSQLTKQHNALTRYHINTSSQMIFLPNKQYQKVTLVSYSSNNYKPNEFEYMETGTWSISGQYIEATPNNISDNSLSNNMVNLLQRNNLLDIKTKQTYHMSVSFMKKPILKNLSFMPREFY